MKNLLLAVLAIVGLALIIPPSLSAGDVQRQVIRSHGAVTAQLIESPAVVAVPSYNYQVQAVEQLRTDTAVAPACHAAAVVQQPLQLRAVQPQVQYYAAPQQLRVVQPQKVVVLQQQQQHHHVQQQQAVILKQVQPHHHVQQQQAVILKQESPQRLRSTSVTRTRSRSR